MLESHPNPLGPLPGTLREEDRSGTVLSWDVARVMDDSEWRRVNRAVAGSLKGLPRKVRQHLHTLARSIAEGIRSLDPIYDRFCVLSYPRCQDVCCRWSTVFYHITDLVFIHALRETPPPHQTRSSARGPCRYLGAEGCVLPRVKRPYRCTWYMCELHLECFNAQPPKVQRQIYSIMEEIRLKKQMLIDSCLRALEE